MCGGGGAPSAPAYEYKKTAVAEEQDPDVVEARDSERKRKIAATSKTILTSASGVSGAAPVQTKTLLGQ